MTRTSRARAVLGRVSRPFWRELAGVRLSPSVLAPALHSRGERRRVALLAVLGSACCLRRLRDHPFAPSRRRTMARRAGRRRRAVRHGGARECGLPSRHPARPGWPMPSCLPALLGAWALGLCWGQRWRRRPWQVVVQLFAMAAVVASVGASMQIGGWTERIEYTGVERWSRGRVRPRAQILRICSPCPIVRRRSAEPGCARADAVLRVPGSVQHQVRSAHRHRAIFRKSLSLPDARLPATASCSGRGIRPHAIRRPQPTS